MAGPASAPRTPELADRRVLVTGAGSGIGLATAARLRGHGARVAAVVQDAAQAAQARDQLPGALVLQQDLLDEAGCAALPARAAEGMGGLDGLACCAGIFFKQGSDDTSVQEWRQTLDLNLTSTFLLTRAAIACMRRLPGAAPCSVVVVTSQIGLVGHARGAAYAASKAGLNGMVRSLALEWAGEGIRVNAVGPGPVRTAMVAAVTADPVALATMEQSIPMGRLGEPHEIGELISFLLSARAAFITGQVVCADGGFTAR
jgi:NAD(P)-dependent dehydrogenase (short-subunit alcohol dehydrogenase family)